MYDLSTLLRQYLEHLEIEKNRSFKTIENYQHYLERFILFAEQGNIKNPDQITQDVIRQYRLYLNRFVDKNGQPIKKITQNYHSIALRSFLKYLAKRDIATLSAEKVELAKQDAREVSFLTAEELDRLMKSPEQFEDHPVKRARDEAILVTLFSTGLRVSELTSLNRDQVDLERGEFSVRGKGNKMRIVFLSDDAKEKLKQYLAHRRDAQRAVFIPITGKSRLATNAAAAVSSKESRLTPRSIERLIQRYASLAGIIKKVTPHTMRHSFATDLLMNGADIRSVQTMLGHASITTTQIYTHITNQQLREVHQAFHGRGKKDAIDE